MLSVFKIEKLDPSLVPRITEDELYDRKPYDFVKVSFELPEGMEVDKAKEDVKQVLSPQRQGLPARDDQADARDRRGRQSAAR